jgi:hypothetical protein
MKRDPAIFSICAAILLIPSAGHGEVADTTPKIGYLLPAGGQRGSTVEITISGNQIANATQVLLQNRRIVAEVVHAHANKRGYTPRVQSAPSKRRWAWSGAANRSLTISGNRSTTGRCFGR